MSPFTHFALVALHNNVAGPFGLSFSPTTVIASRINAADSFELTKFPVSSAYKSLYHDAIRHYDTPVLEDPQRQANLQSMFYHITTSVIESLSSRLGHQPDFASLFLPSIFDYDVRNAASAALFAGTKQTTKLGPSRQATCHGYGFLQGKNLGRAPEEYSDEGPESLIFVLEYEKEYEKEYLYAWLMEAEYELGTYYVHQDKICIDCGENHSEKVGAQAYEERTKQFLCQFIDGQVLQKHRRKDIRAVVVSGEASTEGNSRLGIMALEAVGTEEVNLMTDIDPSEVVSHGAAIWARITQQHPENFIIHDGNRIPDEDFYIKHEAMRRLHKRDEL